MERECKACGLTKPIDQYYITKHPKRNYTMTRCKPCHIARTSARNKRVNPRMKKSLVTLPPEVRERVLQFVELGYPPKQIAKLTEVPYRDLMRWKYAGKLPYPVPPVPVIPELEPAVGVIKADGPIPPPQQENLEIPTEV